MTDKYRDFEALKRQVVFKKNRLKDAQKFFLYLFIFFSSGLMFTEIALDGEWEPMIPITAVGAIISIIMHLKTGDSICYLETQFGFLERAYNEDDFLSYQTSIDVLHGQPPFRSPGVIGNALSAVVA